MAKQYKFIVTFSFSDDDIRGDFIELLENNDFEEEPDQSTYSLDACYALTRAQLFSVIQRWINTTNGFDLDDNIVIYYRMPFSPQTITRRLYVYNQSTRRLTYLTE